MIGLHDSACFMWNTYIRDNFRAKGPFFTKDKYPDLTGQTWVVTGATGGIGLELAKILVNQNAHVWIIGRNETKIEAALRTLRELKPMTNVESATIDYNDLTTVKPGLQKLKRSTTKLHGIIHNAGVMNVPVGSKTKQGYEQQLGVNVLATQLVQDLLDPLIENTAGGRIVWLSSVGHAFAPENGFNIAKTESFMTMRQYGQSKALNYIQSVQWTRKHPESPVKALSAHPGIIQTDLYRTTGKSMTSLTSLVEYDVEHGTYSPIYAALSPDAANNDYIIPWGRRGDVRPDIYRAAHNELGEEADQWIEEQIALYK